MKIRYFTLILSFLFNFSVTAQLSEPNTEEVYGGRILSINGYQIDSDTSRIIITTESANSAFYANVYLSGMSYVFEDFTVLASMDANTGLGSGISVTAVHESGVFFYAYNGELFQTHPDSSMSMSLTYMGVNSITVQDSVMLFLSGNELNYGLLDINGNFTHGGAVTLPVSGGPNSSICVAPNSHAVYIFDEGISPTLIKMDEAYNAIYTGSYSDISPSSLSSVNWKFAGIGLDDRIFVGGSDFNNLYFAYSDDEVTWLETNTGVQGAGGRNFAFSGSSSSYTVYTGKMYNTTNGSGTWSEFGNVGFETHPNDGAVFQDPNFSSVVYMTTDQGIGASGNNGMQIFEINNGVEAVQVKGFDMSDDKNLGWVASKSGIRKVTGYTTTTPSWSNAIYPNGDGSPYYSVGLNHLDTDIVYVGNVRVYKSVDAGMNWNMVFTAENSPWNYPSYGTIEDATLVSVIEVCPYDTDVVMAGYYREGSAKGGLFVSTDAGANWSQILIEASVDGEDVDVRDIIFNIEGLDTVAYVGVKYDLSDPQGVAVYRLVKSGYTWTPSQDMGSTGTVVGYQIVATIRDLALSVTGDTIFATGTDAGINHPIVYFKDLNSTGLWEAMTTTGFPFVSGKKGRAIAVGVDTLYCAVDNEIYFYLYGSSSWQLGYVYPVGTEINFLFYDDLLVGTSTGLYGHVGSISGVLAGPTCQTLEMPYGWSMFSTYMIAADMDLTPVLSPIIDNVIIAKNNSGAAYLVEWGFNGVGDLIVGQGYQIKTDAAVSLEICGDYAFPEDNPINLTAGWNIVAYLRTEGAPSEAVLGGITASGNLIIAKDFNGAVYLPEWDFNGIGDLVPGQGYQLKTYEADVLQYLSNDDSY